MDPDLKAFYQYHSMHMEPWDGPAGIVLTDGRYACCLLDRNGLRPARWVTTDDGFITLASEVGTYDYTPESVTAKGRVGPGQILVIDTETGQVFHTKDIDEQLKSSHPYKRWLREHARHIEGSYDGQLTSPVDPAEVDLYQKMFQVSLEERDQVLKPLAESGNEAVGSMGDDTPMAVLSAKERSLYDYFRQKFAQVTNPPIDPLREAIVMSLEVDLVEKLMCFWRGSRTRVGLVLPRRYYRKANSQPSSSSSRREFRSTSSTRPTTLNRKTYSRQ